jgi:hypothetical protein
MTHIMQNDFSGQVPARYPNSFNSRITTNWPPAYRTIDGSLSPIPGSFFGSFYVSSPAICLPDRSLAIITLD